MVLTVARLIYHHYSFSSFLKFFIQLSQIRFLLCAFSPLCPHTLYFAFVQYQTTWAPLSAGNFIQSCHTNEKKIFQQFKLVIISSALANIPAYLAWVIGLQVLVTNSYTIQIKCKGQLKKSLGMYCVKILFQSVLKVVDQILESLLLIILNIPLVHKVSFNPFSCKLVRLQHKLYNFNMLCITLIVTS